MKPTPTHRIVRFAGLTLLVIALGACSGGDDRSDPTTAGQSSVTATTTAPDVPLDGANSTTTASLDPSAGDAPPTSTSASGTATTGTEANETSAEERTSPLDPFVGIGVTSSDTVDGDDFSRQQLAHAEAIARCMNAEGFEFVPYAPEMSFVVEGNALVMSLPAGGDQDLPPGEYARQYGYGISTAAPTDGLTPPAPIANPNDPLVDALSVSERVAYYRALYGDEVALRDDGHLAPEEIPDDDTSCWRRASLETFGDGGSPEPNPLLDPFRPLLEAIGDIDARVEADPRMVAAHQAWSDCMADAGHPGYVGLEDGRQDVRSRAIDLLGSALDTSSADPDALAELRAFEISVATADQQCRVAFDATYGDVRFEIETEFVETNRSELEQYRDIVSASGSASAGG